MEFMKVCRACSAEKTNLLNLFANDGDDEPTLGEKFFACTSLNVEDTDELPQSICYACAKILETAFKFRKQCERSDNGFRKKVISTKRTEIKADIEEEPAMVTQYLDEELEEDKSNQIEPIEVDSASSDEKESDNKVLNVSISLDNRSFNCQNCEKSFFTEKALSLHANIYHKIKNSSTNSSKLESKKCHSCSKCEKTFDTANDCRTHELTDHSDQPFVCEACGKEYRTKTALRIHVATHADYRPYHCKICKKRYTDYRYLYRHMLYHESKVFKCFEPDCEKIFNVKHKLVDHLRRFHDKNLTNAQVRQITPETKDEDDNSENNS